MQRGKNISGDGINLVCELGSRAAPRCAGCDLAQADPARFPLHTHPNPTRCRELLGCVAVRLSSVLGSRGAPQPHTGQWELLCARMFLHAGGFNCLVQPQLAVASSQAQSRKNLPLIAHSFHHRSFPRHIRIPDTLNGHGGGNKLGPVKSPLLPAHACSNSLSWGILQVCSGTRSTTGPGCASASS